MRLFELEDGFKAELESMVKDLSEDDITDLIYELADSWVPIYTRDLLEVCQDNLRFATSEPEFEFSTPLD